MVYLEQFDVTIPSDTAEGMAVQERVLSALDRLEFSPRDVFGVRLALEEALVNAIKHGNRLDPKKQVRVSCWIDRHRVEIRIEDEGRGFCPADIPDPTAEENLEKPSGRGIMLMRAFMDSIEYNDRGNCVTLRKLRAAESTAE